MLRVMLAKFLEGKEVNFVIVVVYSVPLPILDHPRCAHRWPVFPDTTSTALTRTCSCGPGLAKAPSAKGSFPHPTLSDSVVTASQPPWTKHGPCKRPTWEKR